MKVEVGIHVEVINDDDEVIGRTGRRFTNNARVDELGQLPLELGNEVYDETINYMVLETMDRVIAEFGEPQEYLNDLKKDMEKRTIEEQISPKNQSIFGEVRKG